MPKPTDTKALAALRPGDPKDKLVAAVGERWMEPIPALAGKVLYLQEDFSFYARLDADDILGEVAFDSHFDKAQLIEGVRIDMPEAEVERALPKMQLSQPDEIYGPYRHGHLQLDSGAWLYVRIGFGEVTRIAIDDHSAKYTGRGTMPLPKPKSSFNLAIMPGLQPRGTAAPDGWCCGLPRGIKPAQWPLASNTGFPLEHHFTVRVPESYRTKGPQYVALAVFANAGDDSRNSPGVLALMNRVFDGRPLPESVEPPLQPFLDCLRNRHPMEFRSKDILRATFSAIWLTEAEFTGAVCEPPALIVTDANRNCSPPDWSVTTSAQRLFGWDGRETYQPEAYYLHRLAGRPLKGKWDLLRLQMTERFDDPNTGLEFMEFSGGAENPTPGVDYVPKYSDTWDALTTKPEYGDAHFGGTAEPEPGQDLTPFFIEFDETMGQINMAGRHGRIDLVTMMVNW